MRNIHDLVASLGLAAPADDCETPAIVSMAEQAGYICTMNNGYWFFYWPTAEVH